MNKNARKGSISFMNSIKTKLIAVMVLVTAVPLLVSILASYITSSNRSLRDAKEKLTWECDSVKEKFINQMDANLNMIKIIAGNPTIINYVAGTADIPYDAAQSTIIVCDEVLNDGDTISVTDATGMQVIRGKGDFISVAEREYFKEAMKGQVFVSNVTVNEKTGRRFITFAAPVMMDGKAIGIVHRNYDLNNFHEILAAASEDAFIADRTGRVAAHSQYAIGEGAHEEEVRDKSVFMTSGLSEGFYSTDTGKGYSAYVSYVKEPTSGYTVCAATDEKVVLRDARSSANAIVAAGLILLIASVIISVVMARSFANPIQAVNDSLADLSDGRFTKVTKYDARKDEFGSISKATNTVIDKLDEIVSAIKGSASDVGKSSEELADMADQISKTAEDVSTAVQEIASGATQQADEIQHATENVGYIGEAVGNVKESSLSLTELADKMKKASEVSGKSLASLQESSGEMTAKIDEISRTIEATENAVASISEKVEGITSIATQTNLLSLNASIEAARAGEAGRGFAVVAEEIGKLADDSGRMADEIKVEMEKLLTQSQAAVSAAADVKDGNDAQQVALGETLDAVNGMLDDINSTVEGVETISRGAETCESSKDAVVDTMSALSAISEENAASSEETGASMEELSATVTTLASSAADLKDIAEKLNEDMKFFKS